MMNKFQKMMSGTLAGCLIASALMMSAGAANVQTYIPSGTVQAGQLWQFQLILHE